MDRDSPTFEGKGLACTKGGDTNHILPNAYLPYRFWTTLEPIPFLLDIEKIKPNRKHRGKSNSRDSKDDW